MKKNIFPTDFLYHCFLCRPGQCNTKLHPFSGSLKSFPSVRLWYITSGCSNQFLCIWREFPAQPDSKQQQWQLPRLLPPYYRFHASKASYFAFSVPCSCLSFLSNLFSSYLHFLSSKISLP